MSNEVINPFQLFRDDDGDPLAGGSLRIFVNRTSTIGTAFSDSALTVPQSVDPYRLDQFGRVRGDLRWSGLRTVQVRDSNDAQIRVLNDVVTLVDTSGFAINYPSVAAMIADTGLEAGDIAITTSYNLDQRQGGARYLITSSAETVDSYLVHTIAGGGGLQARLLDVEANNNFYVAGAIGNGVADDTTPIQRLLDVGGDIECSNGVFACTGLTLSRDARIYGDGTLLSGQFTSSDMLALSGSDLTITFDGITIDGDTANQTALVTKASVISSITATTGNEAIISFTNVTFQNGPQYDVEADAADDGQLVLYSFGSCRFLGGAESTNAPFLAACILATEGPNLQIEDCYFDLTAAATTDGGRAAVLTSGATFVNPGWVAIAACTFNRMGAQGDGSTSARAAINLQQIGRATIEDCRFLTSTRGAILIGAEVPNVLIQGNIIDSGAQFRAAIEMLVSTEAAPGNDWQIQNNQLVAVPGNGLLLDGATAGVDAARVTVAGNVIDAPTAVAISPHNIEDLRIRDNLINMASVAAVNAIAVDADGMAGVFELVGNTIVNVDGTAIEHAVTSSGLLVVCRGNTIENVTAGIGIQITGAGAAIVKDNAMQTVATTLIDVGTLTTAILTGNSYVGTDPTTWITESAAVTNLAVRDNFVDDIEDSIKVIASAAAIEITSAYHEITGTTAITSATFPADVIGFVSVWRGTDATGPVVTDGSNLNMAGNFTLGQDDTLVMIWDGTNWNELSRSAN